MLIVFFIYCSYEVRDKLLMIMNMIFKKEEVSCNYRKTLIKPFQEKGNKNECCNYRGIRFVFVGSKLLGMMKLFRVRYVVDIVLREEQCGFQKARRSIDQIFTLRLIIEKWLGHNTRLVHGSTDYEQAFKSIEEL